MYITPEFKLTLSFRQLLDNFHKFFLTFFSFIPREFVFNYQKSILSMYITVKFYLSIRENSRKIFILAAMIFLILITYLKNYFSLIKQITF